jgi:putative ABC transport system permease protein
MGIPLRAGRLFDAHDDPAANTVVVINETMARMYWPGESAVGKRIRLTNFNEQQPWVTVVGVTGDVRHFGLDTAPRPEVYRPYAVNPLNAPVLVIRTAADAAALAPAIAAKVRSIAQDVPAYNVYLMQELVDRSTAQRRFLMFLLAGFAGCALLLAVVGVYGMVSEAVARRTRESALALVFRDGAALVGAGIVLGAIGAAGLTRLMSKLLFGVRPLDPLSFAGAALALALFAAVACYLPARKATRVDPMEALRAE